MIHVGLDNQPTVDCMKCKMKVTKYRNGIINTFQTPYSYETLEGTDNNIKVNKQMTQRYRHSCFFCDRIYLI